MSQEMISLEAFLPKLRVELEGAPEPLIERRLRDAVIEACERAPVWTEQLPEIPVREGQQEFELPPPAGNALVHDIVRVMFDSVPMGCSPEDERTQNPYLQLPNRHPFTFHVEKRGTLTLNGKAPKTSDPVAANEPRMCRGLDVFVSLKPPRNCTEVPRCLYDHYYQLVIDGTLGYAFDMRDTPWYDPGEAKKKKVAFEYELAKAKQALDTDFTQRPLQVRPRKF